MEEKDNVQNISAEQVENSPENAPVVENEPLSELDQARQIWQSKRTNTFV